MVLCIPKRLLSGAAPVAVLLMLSSHVAAQQQVSAWRPADALFEQGKQLLDSGATEEACKRFAESQSIEAAVGTLGMLAYCHEKQGRLATAWREYLATAQLASRFGDLPREQAARDRASSLEPGLSTVRVEVREPVADLVLTLSGVPLDRSEWGKPQPIDPGQVVVRACAPEYQCWESTLEVTGNSTSALVGIPPLRPDFEPPQPPVRSAPATVERWVAPAMAGGVAVLGLGLGTYFGVRTISKTREAEGHCASNACDPEGGRLRDEARTASRISNVSFGIALAATAAGVVLWVRRPEREREASPKPTVAIAPGVGGVSLTGGF